MRAAGRRLADSVPVTALELIVIGAAVFVASFMQVISGFGFALLSVPLMTLAVPAKEAVVVSMIVGLAATTRQSWELREYADRGLVRPMVIGAYLGMPIGLWVFVTVADDVLRLMLGVAVLVAVVLLAFRINLHHVGRSLDVGAGFISGILNTSLSTNGPPLVFALQARQLPPDRFRATLAWVFTLSAVVGLVMFIAAGKVTHAGLVGAAVAFPSMLLGQMVGFPMRKHVDGERFRYLVLLLLTVAAVTAIVTALT